VKTRELSIRMTAAEFNAAKGGKELPPKTSKLEDKLFEQILLHGLPTPERQYRFVRERRFRFDFAWPAEKLAVEVQGGYYANGRHNRDPIGDAKKSNLAGLHGWTVLFYKPDEVRNGTAVNEIARKLEESNGNQD
jgi:very-short-patch-repair endonuclease